MDRQKTREQVIHLARQQPEVAMKRANALVSKMPYEMWTWSLRSHVHQVRGEMKEAFEDIDQAIEINHYEPSNHFEKAMLFLKMEDYVNAIISLADAISIGSKLKFTYYDNECLFIRAFCYCKINDFDAAKEDLNGVNDDMQTWIDQLRSKAELLEACRVRRLD